MRPAFRVPVFRIPEIRISAIRIAAIAAGLAALFASSLALAHDWYPHECCNDRDCAVVTVMFELPDGNLRIEIDHRFAVVPRGFAPRPSPDGKAHACLRQIGSDEEQLGWMLVCLFLPGIA